MKIPCFSLFAVLLTLAAPGAGAAGPPVIFSVFVADPNPKWNGMLDEVGQAITNRTGVTLRVEYPVGSADQKIALIAASGQYPDLMAPKGQTAALVESGALLDLTDLIQNHAPHIRRMMGNQLKRLRYSSTDPAIYFIPNNEGMGQTNFDTDAVFKVQLQALKEAGYPRIETLADFEKVIAAYVKKHPFTPEGRPTLGLSLLADDWRIVISTTNPAFWATGLADDGEFTIDPVTYRAQEHYFRPEEREYFRWLNHMNAVGLLDPESMVQRFDQYKAKIAQGRVVALIDAQWDLQDTVDRLKAAGQFERTYGRFGVVTKKGILPAYNQLTGFNGGWGIAITKSCPDPVRAMEFLDYLASDEAQVLNSWGIEGKHYQVINGQRVIPPAILAAKANDNLRFTRTTGIGNYLFSLHYGDGVKDPSGNYYTAVFPETILASYSSAEKEALAAYKVTFWNDLLPPASAFPVKAWGAAWSIQIPEASPLKQHWDREQLLVRRYIPEAILSKPADFDRVYDTLLKELTAATGPLLAEETRLVRDRIALWTR